jgi:hypothetical protein
LPSSPFTRRQCTDERLPPVRPGDSPLEYQLETQAIGAVFWVLRAACVLLFRLVVDVPVAAMRAFGSDEWTIEAVSWALFVSQSRSARYRSASG